MDYLQTDILMMQGRETWNILQASIQLGCSTAGSQPDILWAAEWAT